MGFVPSRPQYHGVMSVQVEDEALPSRKGRKASVRVVSRQQQQQPPPPPPPPQQQKQKVLASARLNTAKLAPRRKVSSGKTTPDLLDAQVSVFFYSMFFIIFNDMYNSCLSSYSKSFFF